MSYQYRTGIRLSTFLLLSTAFLFSDAKVVGKDVFACSPTSFTIGLNFEGECPGNINQTRPGVDGTDCYFVRNSSLALPPIIVRSIQIIENTLDLGSLYVETFLGDFEDGDTLEYTSVTAGDLKDENDVPGGIQLNILGEDSNGVPVTNTVIIDYSNSPNAFPVQIGDEIGWIVIMDLAPARAEYCPAITEAPVTSAPNTESPVTNAPVSSAPETPVPATDAPVTLSPTTSVPDTGAPVTNSPSTSLPDTGAPVTNSPITSVPDTEAPVTNSPITSEPETDAPVTNSPSTSVPETDAPVTASPSTSVPDTDAPVTESPITDIPATEEPVTISPVTQSPQSNAPFSDIPTSGSPVSFVPVISPVILETEFPTDFSMSYDYGFRKGGLKGAKAIIPDEKEGSKMKETKTKGVKQSKMGSETEGAKTKGIKRRRLEFFAA